MKKEKKKITRRKQRKQKRKIKKIRKKKSFRFSTKDRNRLKNWRENFEKKTKITNFDLFSETIFKSKNYI